MGLETAIGSLFAAFGLSGAAGLNPWLPLFTSALLARLDVVELAAPFDTLSSTLGLVLLGALTAADFVGDKIPLVDHVLHLAGTVVAPVSGAILFAGETGLETDLPTLVAVLLGGATAGSIHAGGGAVRPVSTATTGGIANPLLSLGEDLTSLLLVVAAFVLPLVALLLVLALAARVPARPPARGGDGRRPCYPPALAPAALLSARSPRCSSCSCPLRLTPCRTARSTSTSSTSNRSRSTGPRTGR